MVLHVIQLLLVAVSAGDWLSVPRGEHVQIDVNSTPLQILTNSSIGDEQFVRVIFAGESRNKFDIGFTEKVYVEFTVCTTEQEITLPEKQPVVWTIVRKNEEQVMSLLQEGQEVSSLDYSPGGPCPGNSEWGIDDKMSFLKFRHLDNASDAYRALPTGI